MGDFDAQKEKIQNSIKKGIETFRLHKQEGKFTF